jgi:hypothetical protein
MKFLNLGVLLLTITIPAARAHAQGQDQFAFGLSAGATIPSGPAADHHKTGINGALMWGIGSVDSPFGVRFDGMYTTLGDKKSTTLVNPQGSARLTSYTANFLFKTIGGDTRLYIIAGAGGFNYNPNGEGTSAKSDFGINAGLGLWLPMFNGFVEARWYNFYRALPDAETGESGKRSLRIYPITFGIMY